MKQETAFSIFLVSASAAAGIWLRSRAGFDPLVLAQQYLGLAPQSSIVLFSTSFFALLALLAVRQGRPKQNTQPSEPALELTDPDDDELPLVVDDITKPRRRRPKTVVRVPSGSAPGDESDDQEPGPEEIDPSGEWPKPTGPKTREDDSP